MCFQMLKADLSEAERMALLQSHGYEVSLSTE